MVSVKVRAFLVSLIVSLSVFGAIAMWLIPKADTPDVQQPVTVLWQEEDAVTLRLVLTDTVPPVAAEVTFDPARTAITVVPTDGGGTQTAALTTTGAVALLRELGNDLPLTLDTPVEITEDGAYLHLTADTHILTADQVGLLLTDDPTRWTAVVTAAINAVADRDPETLFRLLINHSDSTDLTVEHYVAAHDALVYLWDANTGYLCRAEASQQTHVQY